MVVDDGFTWIWVVSVDKNYDEKKIELDM